ncbi:hypothetical protein FBEOM_1419 [Fusarium beomiforme]|uniref:Uncharacterized protein n=1 Tax=Fusarium beomiforme TaxID=44412 RepID=A0A9P5E4H6_9HYPO|nr:hypothetical protein FBEOM_1419 [Fusarium beomiforme]
MTSGISGIDDWASRSHLWSTREQHFDRNSQEGTPGPRYVFNRPDVHWEAESLSFLSGWNCDQDGPCCTCDCDCQPAIENNAPSGGHSCIYQNNSGTFYDPNQQSHSAGQQPPSRFYTRSQVNTHPGCMREPRYMNEKQDVPSAEDMIYYSAKQQRHLKDAQRRLQDWMRLMPKLVDNDGSASSTHLHEDKKEKHQGHGRNKYKRGMSKRRPNGRD